jgi:hypothetical protein
MNEIVSDGTVPTFASVAWDPLAKWIGRPNPEPLARFGEHQEAPLLRRTFQVAAQPRHALLTIAAMGMYEATLNGRRVGENVIDPPPSQYDKTVFAREYEVTDLIDAGTNALGVILGRGYVSGLTEPTAPLATEPRLLAQLDVSFDDSSSLRIVTGADWRIADSATRDWMFFGETHEARREIEGWDLPDFDDRLWRPAPVHPSQTERIHITQMTPTRVMDTFPPVGTYPLGAESTMFDFGKITAGWARLAVSGNRGTTLTLSYAHRVAQWAPDMNIDRYVLRGGAAEVWEPRFTRPRPGHGGALPLGGDRRPIHVCRQIDGPSLAEDVEGLDRSVARCGVFLLNEHTLSQTEDRSRHGHHRRHEREISPERAVGLACVEKLPGWVRRTRNNALDVPVVGHRQARRAEAEVEEAEEAQEVGVLDKENEAKSEKLQHPM